MHYETILCCQVRLCIMGFRLISQSSTLLQEEKMCVEEKNNSIPVLLSKLNKNDVQNTRTTFFPLGQTFTVISVLALQAGSIFTIG